MVINLNEDTKVDDRLPHILFTSVLASYELMPETFDVSDPYVEIHLQHMETITIGENDSIKNEF